MKGMFIVHIIHLKKEWKSLLFWLLLPLLSTAITFAVLNVVKDETKVPVGIVVEETSTLVKQIISEINELPLLHITELDRQEALHLLEQHKLDSVFIFKSNYEQSILQNDRKIVAEVYASNRSIAYPAVKESVLSLIQQDMSRSKAAFEVKKMFDHYGKTKEWDYEEIIHKSIERQQESSLLSVEFTYLNATNTKNEEVSFFSIWGIWGFFTLISTFFIFDIRIKEQNSKLRVRWLFTNESYERYSVHKWMLFLMAFVLIDMLTLFMFNQLHWSGNSISTLLAIFTFRVTISLLAFTLARQFTRFFYYYLTSLVVSLLFFLLGGAIIPLDGLVRRWPVVIYASPVQPLLMENVQTVWLLIGFICAGLSVWRRRETHA